MIIWEDESIITVNDVDRIIVLQQL